MTPDQNFFVGNPTNTGKIRRYAWKVLFSGVFKMAAFSKTGAGIWMKKVEMGEIGI